MTQPLRIEKLDETLRSKGQIDAQHAYQLRRMIYAKGAVTKSDAEILFKLDHACATKDKAFAELYVEALTDYFVWQSEPKGYVTPELSKFLIDNIASDKHISSKTELELILNVVHWARNVPNDLVTLVLDAVRESVLLSRETPVGANRPRACIGAGDVAILRKALHAPAGDGSLLVTRREAELLFSLNEATPTCDNDPAWREFFVHALANHLMNPTNPPKVPTRDEAAHRERWLDERGSVGQMLAGVGAALARGDVPFADVWSEVDPTGAEQAKREADAEKQATQARLSREAIDADEAAWLVARIEHDGAVDENERALLRFLKQESPSIDGTLQTLIKRVGV